MSSGLGADSGNAESLVRGFAHGISCPLFSFFFFVVPLCLPSKSAIVLLSTLKFQLSLYECKLLSCMQSMVCDFFLIA